MELLSTDKELKKRTRLLPEALFSSIPREKLERYDRQWEAAIAAEATHAGWKFWSLEAWVEIPLVEEWNKRLNESLWPHGIILFVENASGGEAPNNIWQGRWNVVIHPRFRQEDLSLDFSRWPGAPEQPPVPPRWKLLFTPKSR
jgi:hypothetical protein